LGQLYVGNHWQGSWSDNAPKRSISSGVTYICVDHQTQTAHGQYNGVGLFSGYMWGNTLTGFWYEAGYDRPFGPFELTIDSTGSSFSGTWSYYQANSATTSASFTWSARKNSGARPERSQCLAPAASGTTAAGQYETGNYICYEPTIPFENTDQQSAWGAFEEFGNVKGYTPDNGVSLLLSDFYFPDDDDTLDDRLRPENQQSPFGPATVDDDGDTGHHHDDIPTKRIVVGRLISDSEFCGFFWEGLYNDIIGPGGAICLQRTAKISPDLVTCGGDIVFTNGQIDKIDTGITSWLLQEIQDAFDALVLPEVIIVPNDPFVTNSGGVSFTQSSGSTGVTSTTAATSGTTIVTSGGSTVVITSDGSTQIVTSQGSVVSSAVSATASIVLIVAACLLVLF
jgi:hypothetical protein